MNAQKRIKELMAQRGWSNYRLAMEAGLSHSTVANMFGRNNAPTLPTLEAICQAFGITLSQFFSEDSRTPSLTSEQNALLAQWSALTPEQRRILTDLMNALRAR